MPVISHTKAAVMDQEPAGQIDVFLLDDHEIVRRGVGTCWMPNPAWTVVGEAGTAASALGRIRALRPDVAVLDVRLPDGDGVMVSGRSGLRCPR